MRDVGVVPYGRVEGDEVTVVAEDGYVSDSSQGKSAIAWATMAMSAEFLVLVEEGLKCWVPWNLTFMSLNLLDAQSLQSSALSART